MKVKFFSLAFATLASLVVFSPGKTFAGNADSELTSPRAQTRFALDSFSVGKSSFSLRITTGHHIVSDFNTAEIGSPMRPFGAIYISSGILSVADFWLDIPTSSSSSWRTNGYFATTTTLLAAGTYYTSSDLIQPETPRNVIITSSFTVGFATSVLGGVLTINGVDSVGRSRTEQISFTTNTGTGFVPWAIISSATIVFSTVSPNLGNPQAGVYIGYGNRIGLTNDLVNPGYVYKVTDSNANIATNLIGINESYDTVIFTNAPNGSRDYKVWYRAERSPERVD